MEDNTFNTITGLLKQTTSKDVSKSGASSRCETPTKSGNKPPTIFDLSENDRNRVLKLIEELLETQEEADKLREKLNEERAESKEKRNVYMNKLDRLSEKHEKALSDIQLLKERYYSSLKLLEEKISSVSDKLETSALEIKELRQANAELVRENVVLKKINSETSAAVICFREEKSRESLKQKEKRYRRQLTKAISEVKANADDERRLSSLSSFDQGVSASEINFLRERKNIAERCSGAGDCLADKTSISSDFETIKAPAIVILEKSVQSALNIASDAKVEVPVPASPSLNSQKLSSFNFGTDTDDTILLENLFFRF